MSEWIKVKKNGPVPLCPICRKDDWCLVASDGSVAICARISDKSVKQVGNSGSGWLHRLTDNPAPVRYKHKPKPKTPQQPAPDFYTLAEKCFKEMSDQFFQAAVDEIGVRPETLRRMQMGCGLYYGRRWQTFPRRNGHRKINGIGLRTSKKKIAVTGSKNSLIWPVGVEADSNNLLFVPEGPTDTAALLDMGFDAIGRVNCGTGLDDLKTAIRNYSRAVVIMADKDSVHYRPDGSPYYPGYDGAVGFAKGLKPFVRSVKIVKPAKHKDIRKWYQAGVTKDQVMALVTNTRFT